MPSNAGKSPKLHATFDALVLGSEPSLGERRERSHARSGTQSTQLALCAHRGLGSLLIGFGDLDRHAMATFLMLLPSENVLDMFSY